MFEVICISVIVVVRYTTCRQHVHVAICILLFADGHTEGGMGILQSVLVYAERQCLQVCKHTADTGDVSVCFRAENRLCSYWQDKSNWEAGTLLHASACPQPLTYMWAVQQNLTSASCNTISSAYLIHSYVPHDVTGSYSISELP